MLSDKDRAELLLKIRDKSEQRALELIETRVDPVNGVKFSGPDDHYVALSVDILVSVGNRCHRDAKLLLEEYKEFE